MFTSRLPSSFSAARVFTEKPLSRPVLAEKNFWRPPSLGRSPPPHSRALARCHRRAHRRPSPQPLVPSNWEWTPSKLPRTSERRRRLIIATVAWLVSDHIPSPAPSRSSDADLRRRPRQLRSLPPAAKSRRARPASPGAATGAGSSSRSRQRLRRRHGHAARIRLVIYGKEL